MNDYDDIYEKLVLNDMEEQLPGIAEINCEPLNENDIRMLVGHASLLSTSDSYIDKSMAYEIVTRLIEIKKLTDEKILAITDLLLSRIGNFPGRKLLRQRHFSDEIQTAPIKITLEKIAREVENTIELEPDNEVILTDFQYSLYNSVTEGRTISVSAPTSAGKSFVLNLALQKRLMGSDKESVIYVVPTRALISEVSQRIRESLRSSNLTNIIIRTAPFPVKKEDVTKGVIYILTQERLNSLLYSIDEGLWVTSIIIDEAHEIQKSKRGVVLQNSIDTALSRFPGVAVLFASPLISNPDYFINLFGIHSNSDNIVERLSPVTQNIILVESVKGRGNTKKIEFSLIGRENSIDLGVRSLDYKYRGTKVLIKSLLAISLTRTKDSTIVFSNGPSDAEAIAESLIDNLEETIINDEIASFIEFIKAEIHPEYPLINCLKKGVAFHYGNMPSIIRNGVEKLFKEEKIQYMCCTSTLLQGVNLPAKNIIIDNPKSGDTPMSRPDFLNLSGRAGRLLKEFHGNIWCIEPTEWASPVYKGEQLEEIKSAIGIAMLDGGTQIHDLLEKKIKKAADIESAEATFSRIYHELVENGRESVVNLYRTDSNSDNLETTINHCESIEITLPQTILEAHKSLRPDHLEALYKRINAEIFLSEIVPLHPFTTGSKRRFETIISIISESFEWSIHQNFLPLLSYLTYEWVRGTSLREIILDRVNYVRGDNPKATVSSIIISVLRIIERDIRFKLEKYVSAYIDILRYVFEQKNINIDENKIEPYHIYLEFGASDRITLNLMALGLSRFTALRLSKYPVFKSIENDITEEYLNALSSIELSRINLPLVCLNEVREIVGVQH